MWLILPGLDSIALARFALDAPALELRSLVNARRVPGIHYGMLVAVLIAPWSPISWLLHGSCAERGEVLEESLCAGYLVVLHEDSPLGLASELSSYWD